MDSPRPIERCRGLLGVRHRLRAVERSSREVGGIVRSGSRGRLKPKSVSPLPRLSLERPALRDTELRKRLLGQLDLLREVGPVFDWSSEFLASKEERDRSPLGRVFRPTSPHRIPSVQAETQTLDTRKWAFRVQCGKCGVVVLCPSKLWPFECLFCRTGRTAVPSEICGALCVETMWPLRSHGKEERGTVLRVVLSEGLLHQDVLSAREHLASPGEQEEAIRQAVSALNKTASAVGMELRGLLEEQAGWQSSAHFSHLVQTKAPEAAGQNLRCMRTLLRGVATVLPEHATALEKSFLALLHLGDLLHQHSKVEVRVLQTQVLSQAQLQEEVQELRQRVRTSECQLLLQEARFRSKQESLARLNLKYEEMLRLRPD